MPEVSDPTARRELPKAVIIAIICSYFLNHTRHGLNLRAVGENPATADAAGINVNRAKYLSTCIGSVIAGFGGLYYVMDYANGVWSNDGFGDRGWLRLSLKQITVASPFIEVNFGFVKAATVLTTEIP